MTVNKNKKERLFYRIIEAVSISGITIADRFQRCNPARTANVIIDASGNRLSVAISTTGRSNNTRSKIIWIALLLDAASRFAGFKEIIEALICKATSSPQTSTIESIVCFKTNINNFLFFKISTDGISWTQGDAIQLELPGTLSISIRIGEVVLLFIPFKLKPIYSTKVNLYLLLVIIIITTVHIMLLSMTLLR